jgi:hypothetical protein
MLTLDEIQNYYENAPPKIPEYWNLSRERAQTKKSTEKNRNIQ